MKTYNNVKWYINNSCNLSCPFCFVKGIHKPEVSLETKFKILDKLHQEGVKFVDFFGKEPLFNKDIFKIMKYGESNNYDFYYTFISNGVNLKKYTKDIINSPCREFTISFDFHSGDRKFKFDLKDLLPFKESGFFIELSIDVHNSNIQTLMEKSKNLKEFGVNSLYFNPIMPFKGVGVNHISESDYEKFIKGFLKEYRDTYEVIFKIPFQMKRLSEKYSIEDKNFYTEPFCSAGIDHFCISSDGIAFGCVSQCAKGNMLNSCDYLTTPIGQIYSILSNHKKVRLCE